MARNIDCTHLFNDSTQQSQEAVGASVVVGGHQPPVAGSSKWSWLVACYIQQSNTSRGRQVGVAAAQANVVEKEDMKYFEEDNKL